jgi:hypothetical protein
VPADLAAFDRRREAIAAPPPLPVEWCEEIEPQLEGLWLVKRLLPQVGLALLYGHPGCGKTFLGLDLSMHCALGWPWNGRAVRKGLVVYVAAEGQRGLKNRIYAFRQHHRIDGPIPLALIPAPIDLQAPDADRARLAATIQIAAKRYGEPPVLIAVDTISKTFGAGKENTDDMALFVANCGWLASEFACCLLAIHHRPKNAESSEPRGHSSLKGGLDTVVLVEGGPTKRATVTKQRDADAGEAILFNLRSVDLGVDEDGEPVTTCVVEPTDIDLSPSVDPFARAVAKLSPGARLVYDELGEILKAEGTAVPDAIPDAEIDRSRVAKVASLEAWRDKSISAAGTASGHSRDTGKRTFNRHLESLRSKGIVRVWNEWAWITFAIGGTHAGQ